MAEEKKDQKIDEWKAGPGAYVALLVAIIFFSGLLMQVGGMKWLSAFDFTTLGGTFGTMKEPAKNNTMLEIAERTMHAIRRNSKR